MYFQEFSLIVDVLSVFLAAVSRHCSEIFIFLKPDVLYACVS